MAGRNDVAIAAALQAVTPYLLFNYFWLSLESFI